MTEIPENAVTQKDLEEWYALHKELSRIKTCEMLLRTKIFKGLFKDPVEGTNSVPLKDGWVLKGKRTINRSIDLASLTLNTQVEEATGMSRLSSHGIPVSDVVIWKPELSLSAYRKLTAEQQEIFNECLIIKDGSPSLEIVLPKKETA